MLIRISRIKVSLSVFELRQTRDLSWNPSSLDKIGSHKSDKRKSTIPELRVTRLQLPEIQLYHID